MGVGVGVRRFAFRLVEEVFASNFPEIRRSCLAVLVEAVSRNSKY